MSKWITLVVAVVVVCALATEAQARGKILGRRGCNGGGCGVSSSGSNGCLISAPDQRATPTDVKQSPGLSVPSKEAFMVPKRTPKYEPAAVAAFLSPVVGGTKASYLVVK